MSHDLIIFALGLVLSIVGWTVNRIVKWMDSVEERLEEIEREKIETRFAISRCEEGIGIQAHQFQT